MEFTYDVGLFLAKAAALAAVLVLSAAALISLSRRTASGDDTELEIRLLGEQLENRAERLADAGLAARQRRRRGRQRRRERRKRTAAPPQKRLFVLNFQGDIRASAVANLREEVNAVLAAAGDEDRCLLVLDSAGGVIPGYGLAASQLDRLRRRGIHLTIAVDKIAASGGYMMACVADRLTAAPFAILGSIGVIGQLPNFNRLLKRNDIDFEQHTAGEYKRTLTLFGENTEEARERFREDLAEAHELFKAFVAKHRPALEIDRVATGEYWFGEQALELGLVDTLATSDDLLLEARPDYRIVALAVKRKRHWLDRLAQRGAAAVRPGAGGLLEMS